MTQKPEERPPGEPHAAVRFWLGEIAAAKRRERDFRKDGREIIEIYSGEASEKTPFNILYSNTETLLPALFSQVPRPVVQRRFKDEDPLGKAAAMAAQRMLEYLCDTNVEGYETFEAAMTAATLDGLLPGRGVTAVSFDAEVEGDAVLWQQVCTESTRWDGVHFGYAKKWSSVPWVAYEKYMDAKEAERMFGAEIAAKITYSDDEAQDSEEGEENKGVGVGGRDEDEATSGRKTALVYQIWDRAGGKTIRYVSAHYLDGYLKEAEDPYKLTGFFNCPRPLQFLEKSSDLVPTALYKLYENQAAELNDLTTRIQKIVRALKVRGAYDGALGELVGDILKGDDNELVATDDGATLATQGGLEKAIWLMPLDRLIMVLRELIASREACKRVIYEITGVSDIVRGQSVASETLGAQKIKEAWGTMRLKRLQKAVQRYARDTMRLMLELAAAKLPPRTWAAATGLPFVTAEQKGMAQQIAQAAQQVGQEPDETVAKALSAPVWEDVLKLLQNDMQRSYRIDIETNSTLDVEATEDQQNVSEVLQAIAQFLHGVGPLVENGTMDFGVAQQMLLTIVRRFRFGTEVEDSIKAMQPPKPKDDGTAGETQQAMAELQQKHAAEMAQMQQDAQQADQDRQFQAQEALAHERAESARKMGELQQKHAAELEKANTERMKASMQRDTELKKTALTVAGQIEIARIGAASAVPMTGTGVADETTTMAAILETQQRLLAHVLGAGHC